MIDINTQFFGGRMDAGWVRKTIQRHITLEPGEPNSEKLSKQPNSSQFDLNGGFWAWEIASGGQILRRVRCWYRQYSNPSTKSQHEEPQPIHFHLSFDWFSCYLYVHRGGIKSWAPRSRRDIRIGGKYSFKLPGALEPSRTKGKVQEPMFKNLMCSEQIMNISLFSPWIHWKGAIKGVTALHSLIQNHIILYFSPVCSNLNAR